MDKKWLDNQIGLLVSKKYAKPLTMRENVKQESRKSLDNKDTRMDINEVLPHIVEKTVELIKFKGKSLRNNESIK